MRYMIATDTGGTFTDVAVFDRKTNSVSYGKSLTNYGDLIDGVLTSLEDTQVHLDEALLFKHGTTHVINTLIERTGAKAALITTRGFRDTLEIGRGNRPVPFALQYRRDKPLIERRQRYEVTERMSSNGEVLEPLQISELVGIADQLRKAEVEAVAVSFVNAYANPAHEEEAVRILSEELNGVYVTSGTTLTREWFEYERTSTAAANAYVGSRMAAYVAAFDEKLKARGFRGTFYMMGSNGGVLSSARAIQQPVALVESGPIGGCIGAAAYADALGLDRVIAFDMGGTTAKCALVQDGNFDVQPVYYVNGYDHGFPLKTPVLDIVEVGAGGGSIASVNSAGRLMVGPRSAGSEPGPVAFGRGGVEPTVTDANLVLGRIGAGSFLNGKLRLDYDAAVSAIKDKVAGPLGYTDGDACDVVAQGILDIATTTMASAIKEITIERGHDTRDFALMAFGGGGPLFATILARRLKIPRVIIPPYPGNFSTLGMLTAGAKINLARMVVAEASQEALDRVHEVFSEIEAEAKATMKVELGVDEVECVRALEIRYRGQKHTVRIPYPTPMSVEALCQLFIETYRQRYGHANSGNPIEILEVRVEANATLPRPSLEYLGAAEGAVSEGTAVEREVYFPGFGRVSTQVLKRDHLKVGMAIAGPAVIEEFSSTTILVPGDRAHVGRLGEISIDCVQE